MFEKNHKFNIFVIDGIERTFVFKLLQRTILAPKSIKDNGRGNLRNANAHISSDIRRKERVKKSREYMKGLLP